MVYCQVLFVSEKMVIGVGFDCNPLVFAADETGIWYAENLLFFICAKRPHARILPTLIKQDLDPSSENHLET